MPFLTQDPEKDIIVFHKVYHQLKKAIQQKIIGQDRVIDYMLISLFAKGHTLLVGVPGLAKTLIVKTIAEALELKFSRIQFTPDLMPSDITGTEVIEENMDTGKKNFRFIHGPIFANIILADEINRTPPKTQAALLEAMQEQHVTIGNLQHHLSKVFFVLATQNPIEQEGTYPLPEAQLDRFMLQIHLNYPSIEEEITIVKTTTRGEEQSIVPIMDEQALLELQQMVQKIPIPSSVIQYAVRLVHNTRPKTSHSLDFVNKYIRWGAGPRASQHIVLCAKAHALSRGNAYVDETDIRMVAIPALRHRLVCSYTTEADGITTDQLIERIINHTK